MTATMKPRIVNFFGGPGSGKSSSAAALFSVLKFRGVNCEYVQEYAKDAAWEGRSPKIFAAQEYIFGKQSFRVSRVASEVDLVITDSPVLIGMAYMDSTFPLPSMRSVLRESHALYDSLNVFVMRTKPYLAKGRYQEETDAQKLDVKIFNILKDEGVPFINIASDLACRELMSELKAKNWLPDNVFACQE